MSARLLAALALGLGLVASVQAADELETRSTRPGVTDSFLLVRPAGEPRASVILFAGGNGALRLKSGSLALGGCTCCATSRRHRGASC